MKRTLQELGIDPKWKIIVGVSGGADSVALLRLLADAGADITVVHCNFQLRGAESDRDQKFVETLCVRLGIIFRNARFDVESYRKIYGGSLEMCCRNLRYEFMTQQMMEMKADRIAVAHNLDDQAETMLLNLMRGAGVSGLRGMLPDNGTVIRPLLTTSRREILEYLEEIGQDYVTDSTNSESIFARNFLRNKVIPLLETRWPHAKKSICRSASNLAEEEYILDEYESGFYENDGSTLTFKSINNSPDMRWIIRRFAAGWDASDSQVEEILGVLSRRPVATGKWWKVRDGRIVVERGSLEYYPDEKLEQKTYKIRAEEMYLTDSLLAKIQTAPLTECWTTLPPEKVSFGGPEKGEVIYPLGMMGGMKVSKVIKDAKLSQKEKEDLLVARDIDTGKVLWIHGLKRSCHHLVNSKSQKIYKYTRESS